jgi:hypothetical protein
MGYAQDEMRRYTRHDGAPSHNPEHDKESRAADDGPDRAEEDVAHSGLDCGEGVVVARIVPGYQPCCDTQLQKMCLGHVRV